MWRVELSKDWDVLGPFPIHAREQHFLSPSFPINVQEPIDLTKKYPSSYADGGSVSWTTATSNKAGEIKVAFPNIRWQSLRATEGWAALQHHAVLRGTLTVSATSPHPTRVTPRLLVQLLQGAFFTIVPSDLARGQEITPRWYHGNVYAMERALPQAVDLPVRPDASKPTQYTIFISGDFEIRLFGDPSASKKEYPIQSLQIGVDIDLLTSDLSTHVTHEPTQDVICDFVDGWAFGNALGIGIRSVDGWWTVKEVTFQDRNPDKIPKAITLRLKEETHLAPSQTRVLPIVIEQNSDFHEDELRIRVWAQGQSTRYPTTVSITIPVKHLKGWGGNDRPKLYSIKASYFYAHSMPTNFMVVPPLRRNEGVVSKAPILCLHGAGVDIIGTPWWVESLPRMNNSWLVIPTGRTSWGMDWHGPSAKDAWASLDALVSIAEGNPAWKDWRLPIDPPAVVLGHSNGGQGTWYLASRYPDRVLAAIPMAAYIKSQAYVPLTQSRSGHYMDPALQAILLSTLTPDDNDLFLSNLVDIPVLAIHGGIDDNVPVWHSREYISIIKTLNPDANATYREDAGQLHWYPEAVTHPDTLAFIEKSVNLAVRRPPAEFTLTVANPSESGSMYGLKVVSLLIPGRLGRLKVRIDDRGFAHISPINISAFQVDLSILYPSQDYVNLTGIYVDTNLVHSPSTIYVVSKQAISGWQATDAVDQIAGLPRPPGRAQLILTSDAPLTIVVPPDAPHELSIALRIAHVLGVYHKLDTSIVTFSQYALANSGAPPGNLVLIGNPATSAVEWLLRKSPTPWSLRESSLFLQGRAVTQAGQAVVSTFPHPALPSTVLLLSSNEGAGLERAYRQFPLRTGVTTPDWLVMSEDVDNMGAAGLDGAGTWAREWVWNEPMSWLN
ncbi:Peptidase S9 prolyl oligopeptidase catalytic domain-containing protein [Pleurotus pulmonarius]